MQVTERQRMRDQRAVALLLDREVDKLDHLIAEVRHGIRDQRHYDTLEERAQGIANRLRAAFRGERA